MPHPLLNGRYLSLRAALAVCAVLVLAAVFVIAGARLSPPLKASALPKAVEPPAAADPRGQQTADEGDEAELITILPSGFEPAEITRPRGKFLLVIDNRSGLGDVTWRLDREAGGRLHEVRLSGGRLHSGQFEDLPPGTYLLTEAGHLDWTCRIRITPN